MRMVTLDTQCFERVDKSAEAKTGKRLHADAQGHQPETTEGHEESKRSLNPTIQHQATAACPSRIHSARAVLRCCLTRGTREKGVTAAAETASHTVWRLQSIRWVLPALSNLGFCVCMPFLRLPCSSGGGHPQTVVLVVCTGGTSILHTMQPLLQSRNCSTCMPLFPEFRAALYWAVLGWSALVEAAGLARDTLHSGRRPTS